MWGRGTAAILLLLSLGTLPLLALTTVPGYTWVIAPIALATVGVAVAGGRTSGPVPSLPWLMLALSAAIAVCSIVTGLLNGLSDEPYSTPAYAALGLGMYTHPVHFTYIEYGRSYVENSYDVYLPLLTFIQVPGLDYRWVSLAAWAVMIYLLRGDPRAAIGLSVPWVAVLAANGQNDFVPLVAITFVLAVRPARFRWAWEVVALGLKQFANVIVFAVHLARREYRAAVLALVATLLLLLPFLVIDPSSVVCHVLLGAPGGTCQPHSAGFFLFKRNYWLYPIWILLVFYRPIASWLARHGLSLPGEPPRTEALRPTAR